MKKENNTIMIKKRKKKWDIVPIIVLGSFFILFLLLSLPVINTISDFERRTILMSQYHSIDVALEFFNSEFNGYTPSGRLDPNGIPYCGAMKLAEAMVGQDLLGIHPNSILKSDGKDPNGIFLYDTATMSRRKGPYLPIENANAFRINEIFKETGSFNGNEYLICDTYIQKRNSGQKIGMPILYYKADTSKSSHDVNNPDNPDNIYNYKDNYDLLALGVPGKPGVKHPLYEDPSIFYIMTQNTRAKSSLPFNKDTYILISAGPDGLFGTSDDITNFDFKWRPKEEE